jgi:hypothetical protein
MAEGSYWHIPDIGQSRHVVDVSVLRLCVSPTGNATAKSIAPIPNTILFTQLISTNSTCLIARRRQWKGAKIGRRRAHEPRPGGFILRGFAASLAEAASPYGPRRSILICSIEQMAPHGKETCVRLRPVDSCPGTPSRWSPPGDMTTGTEPPRGGVQARSSVPGLVRSCAPGCTL